MFEKLKLAGQLGGMMKDLPKLRARVDEIKARLATTEVVAEVGGGAVRVRATCDLHITHVELLRPNFPLRQGRWTFHSRPNS